MPDADGHFGVYGGVYVPETLMTALQDLEKAYLAVREDPEFQAELAQHLQEFAGRPQALGLPSAPTPFLRYHDDDARPQTRLDRDAGAGQAVSIGRLRPDAVFDWRFVALSHNTVRGAAGGAVLTAELLKADGYLTAK